MLQTVVLYAKPKRFPLRELGSFRLFLFEFERKAVRCVRFFVDHHKQRIHRKVCAGDSCDFNDSPAEKREFTDSKSYVTDLEEKKGYSKCSHCETFSLAID
ncbi:hypothetical protein SAMN04488053_105110 [Alkalicoccus daliensis]|uniref:Uncharacterized protein n=1 Tax=Alkalicoccus daliensis TaxID=745820 RepID=A0A1H0FVM2_9BACI|nr:hypothetical protein SAMN04488053_105110 [Alkalicoccus daliensis]